MELRMSELLVRFVTFPFFCHDLLKLRFFFMAFRCVYYSIPSQFSSGEVFFCMFVLDRYPNKPFLSDVYGLRGRRTSKFLFYLYCRTFMDIHILKRQWIS